VDGAILFHPQEFLPGAARRVYLRGDAHSATAGKSEIDTKPAKKRIKQKKP
jgi:hypothetical protein